jgi:preprotein translocase subunit SecE
MKMFDGIIRFFQEVKAEMKSVTWPTKDDLREGTLVVITMSAIVALFLSAVDFIFGLAVKGVFK